MQKILKQLVLVITMMVVMLTVMHSNLPHAFALGYDEFLNTIGEEADLPTYESGDAHEQAYNETGLESITSALYYVLDYIKYVLGGIAVLFMVISAYQLLTAGEGSDEEIKKQKEYFTWAIVGLIFVFAADTLVKDMFFGEEGQILQDEETALTFAGQANKGIRGIYMLLEVFVGAGAVLAIAYDGSKMVIASYNEEEVTNAKKHIFWALIGLFFIGTSELIVKKILFPYEPGEGAKINVSEGKIFIANITNFISAIIGFVSIGMLIYGGYLYVTGGVSEENTGKAKKVIFGAIAGILLAGAAFAVASTIIPMDPGT
ncbi:hypothetical protein A2448_02505 [Candidatus Peregrinibacteria bacterium RIFOXYC2_FULL_41_22]|nr:MAG: hypothetical protein A2448_02505 [Candidatus Peregrinibacteria bacterium RIFOXYC2_FULL_41_22]